MILKKIFLLLSLLVSPKVFSEGGICPSQFPPVSQDTLIGKISVYAEAATDFQTFRIETETYYTLNFNSQTIIIIVADHYQSLVCRYCDYLKAKQNDPAIKLIRNGPS